MKLSRFVLFSLLMGVLLLLGCGGASGTKVSGKVTYKNKPVSLANLTFVPADNLDEGRQFSGMTSSEGRITVDTQDQDGLPAGKYEITVDWWLQKNGKPVPDGEEGETMKENGTAIHYRASLTKDVKGESTVLNLSLDDANPTVVRDDDEGGEGR